MIRTESASVYPMELGSTNAGYHLAAVVPRTALFPIFESKIRLPFNKTPSPQSTPSPHRTPLDSLAEGIGAVGFENRMPQGQIDYSNVVLAL
ncbi:MAG TPA: hypothetical protein VE398_09670, partial [Acidobacteriota bacterium]|nr:hypothetical protein [Acidobacteriota bacterium]